MIDRFGDVPKPVSNLLTVALLRAAAVSCKINSVVEDGSEVKIYPTVFNVGIWSDLSFEYRGRISVIMSEPPAIRFRKQAGEDTPQVLYELFKRYMELSKAEEAEKGNC